MLKGVPLVLLLMLFIYGIYTGKLNNLFVNKKSNVNKKVIEQILRDIYTPSSMSYFKDRAQYYYDNNILTESEAKELFVSNGADELTEEDKKRTLSIYQIAYSDKDSNSVLSDMYKANCVLKYNENTIGFEIIFELNNDGVIYKHVVNEIKQ
jgi:hypothetical protein